MIHPRPEIKNIAPIEHGGHVATHPRDLLDFSANVNPYGPSPRTWDALRDIHIGQYPDPRATPLRNFLAEIEKLDAQKIIVGNGAIDLIQHIAIAFVRPGDRVLIAAPTFSEYARVATMMGAEIINVNARAENNFAIEPGALLNAARVVKPRLLFLCNPNNPTGALVELAAVENLLRACPETLVVVDEAFIRFVSTTSNARELLRYENLLVLRSLTKDYALTGLRVGYAMASPEIIATLEKVQPPWSVNSFAQAAAIAALRDESHLRDSLAALALAKHNLVNELTQLGFAIVPSPTHFFLMRVDSAKEFAAQLRAQNIWVRDGTSFGLPEYVRIATRTPAENARLIQAIKELQ